ncbi:MAG: TonB-dependent receptor [Acidobacteriota bacterium]|nr:TonB-dependent receptor [Acidobacteriota bacterium]
MSINRIGVIFCWALLAGAQIAGAQELGTVTGRVTDQTGGALPGVTVDLVAGTREMSSTTDLAGDYRFEAVPAGPAALTYRLLNFTVVRRQVTVTRGGAVRADALLLLSLRADIVVTAAGTFRNVADAANPSENLVGIASAASQGAITAAQLDARPVMRAGEVLETVPGMIVSQHSGEGKANQYYLRGFNLDHGTDFATTVAGVPVNTPTGAHSHGWTDLNFLIPELVSGVQFKKGPYYADEGDFSAAGSANISYANRLDRPLLLASAGHDGWGRVLGAASPRLAGGHVLMAIELNRNDGPWLRGDDFRKVNGVLRYSRGDTRNGLSLTGMGYWANWNATDQIPARAVANGSIDRFGLIDPTDRGTTHRQTLTIELQRSTGSASLRGTGFVLRSRLNLLSNFTYFLDDPINGDQFEQAEQRMTAGGRLTYRRLGHFFERHTESAVGVQVRRDWLSPVGLYRTTEGRRFATIREDEVGQTLAGAYGQTEIEWTPAIRTTFGLRADVYDLAVQSNNPLNSGEATKGLVSPKFSAAFGPWAGTEVYASAGMGFHSNDARGAVIAVDPASGEGVERVTPLVRAKGVEAGVRTVRLRGLQSTAAVWYLGIDSELLFVGDAGTTEAGRPSRRFGIEWTNFARLTRWLTVDGDLSLSRARFTDADPSGNRVPGAVDRVLSGGLTVESQARLSGALRVRHFGPRPLIEDASVKSKGTTLWNAEAVYRLSHSARLELEVFNLFDATVADIDYFYTSRLQGEPWEGMDDIHTHPALPRSARVNLRISF